MTGNHLLPVLSIHHSNKGYQYQMFAYFVFHQKKMETVHPRFNNVSLMP